MASREQDKTPDKAIDGLLRRSLARTSPSQDCPAPDILAAYYERSLDPQETARYDLHFSTCAHCRAQLAAMVRAEPEADKKEASGWGWLTHRWWFVPALATAALALVVSVPLLRKIYNPVPAQQVALNAPPPVAAPASESVRDAETSADGKLLDRLHEKTAPSAAPAGSLQSDSEKESKDVRLVVPQAALAAKSAPSPLKQALAKTQIPDAAPVDAESRTDRFDAAAPAPASIAASRRVAPAQSAGARSSGSAAGGFTAQNQAQQQNQRQNQQQSQPANQAQNEVIVQAQSQTVQVEAQPAPQADSASNGVIGGVAESAPRSDSKKFSTSTTSSHAAAGKAAPKGAAAVRGASEAFILKVFRSPDSDAWWRLPGNGFVEFSPNAGESWHRKLLDADAQLLTGAAPGGKVFWIVGRDGVIYLTTNGTKWKKIAPPANADFVEISARDALFASITASDRRVFTTEDGGKTWTAAP